MLLRLLERTTELQTLEWSLADHRAGVIAAVIANTRRDPKTHPKPYEPRDFFPRLPQAERRKQQSVEDQLLIMRANVHLMAGNPL